MMSHLNPEYNISFTGNLLVIKSVGERLANTGFVLFHMFEVGRKNSLGP